MAKRDPYLDQIIDQWDALASDNKDPNPIRVSLYLEAPDLYLALVAASAEREVRETKMRDRQLRREVFGVPFIKPRIKETDNA